MPSLRAERGNLPLIVVRHIWEIAARLPRAQRRVARDDLFFCYYKFMKKLILLFPLLFLNACIMGNAKSPALQMYAYSHNWMYLPDAQYKEADTFFVYPTVIDNGQFMDINYGAQRASALTKTKQFVGIFSESTNFYAPYYAQYTLESRFDPKAVDAAYAKVKEAFLYYLKHYNKGRPIILAGHSQGAAHLKNLIIDVFKDPALQKQLVAAYLIGHSVTSELTAEYPWLKPAAAETDTGVFISYNAQKKGYTRKINVVVPHAHIINPLNWKTDETVAPKELNLGAVFFDDKGEVTREVKHFTGAQIYLSEEKNILIATDIDPLEFLHPSLDPSYAGSYHAYDYMFYYRNIQQNVSSRLKAFNAK